MLTSSILAETVTRAVADALRGHAIAAVMDEPTQDAVGEAAVYIRIVLAGDDEIIDGDAIVDAMVDVHRALEAAGEDRTVMIGFANEAELAELARYADP